MKLQSLVWDHFAKEVDEEGYERLYANTVRKNFVAILR